MDIGMVLLVGVVVILVLLVVSRFVRQPEATFGDEAAVPTRTTASTDERVYPFPNTDEQPSPADEYPNPAGDVDEVPEEEAVKVYDPRVQQ